VDEFWGSSCFKLYRKQFNTSIALKKWNREKFGHCQSRICELNHKIVEVQGKDPTEFNARVEAGLQA
jgi:hypothetical protein